MSFRIDEPCNEDWDAMEPHESGRFCQSCQHIVLDATDMTKREFEAFFEESKGDVCAQFRANPVGDGVFRRSLTRPRPLGSFVLLSTLLASACADPTEVRVVPEVVQLVDPGSQSVEDKTALGAPLSLPAESMDANIDAAVDAAADVAPIRSIRRGRVRRRLPLR